MLTILGDKPQSGFCDGFSRRGFLTIGGFALGGLALPDVLRANPEDRSHKAIINIYLPGGPSHLDMWDLKPDAPREIRGEFEPIQTNVPGIEICELFPRIASMMDKFIVVRSLDDSDGRHDSLSVHDRPQGQRSPTARRLAIGGRLGVALAGTGRRELSRRMSP